MATKTFRSPSTMQTLQMVQAELGADAIVVSMREVPAGPIWNPWGKTSVEVVAASADTLPELQRSKPAAEPALPEGIFGTEEEVRPEIEWVETPAKRKPLPPKLKLNLDPVVKPESAPVEAPKTRSRQPAPVPAKKNEEKYLPPSLRKIRQQLLDQGVDPALSEGLVDLALETLSPGTLADAEKCRSSLVQLLGAEMRLQQGAGQYVSGSVVCMVGPSGSGKTSALAKLGLFYTRSLHKKVTWICADTLRMGAVAEARAYTDALGFQLELVYAPADLKEIFQRVTDTDIFLLDTPGYNPCSETQMVELGALLSGIPKRCTYMAVPASTREADLFQASASLGMFKLDGLVITKLDETRAFGNVYNLARKSQVPLAFFTTGRDASRHLETADPVRLASALFGKEWNKN